MCYEILLLFLRLSSHYHFLVAPLPVSEYCTTEATCVSFVYLTPKRESLELLQTPAFPFPKQFFNSFRSTKDDLSCKFDLKTKYLTRNEIFNSTNFGNSRKKQRYLSIVLFFVEQLFKHEFVFCGTICSKATCLCYFVSMFVVC